jgi:endonuclease/exonuclease/phosphatase family metal-dependent hydrolase
VTKHAAKPRHRLRHVRVGLAVVAVLTATSTAAVAVQLTRSENRPAGTTASRGTHPSVDSSRPVVAPSSAPSGADRAETLARRAAGERNRLARLAEREAAKAKARARARARANRIPPPAQFRLASFNMLGASHTGPGGDKRGYASGATRTGFALSALRSQDVDVVGFQEYEPVQHHAFLRASGGGWGVFPGTALGNNAVRNSVAWRKDTWTVVEQHTIAIPYFRGARVPMPYVLLEHETGRRVWFINVHNPVSNSRRGNNERWRDVATSLEIGLVNRLHASGTPVVLTGDFNERGEAFCAVTARAGAVAANGGASSPCRPPANAGIDWVFGTSDIGFSGYARQRTPLVVRASDHPLITTTAVVDGPLP